MLETKLYADQGRNVLRWNDGGPLPDFAARDTAWLADAQEARIRDVFQLADNMPLPRVTMNTLARYYAYMLRHLQLPFQALCPDINLPMRQLVRYITVTALLPVAGSASRGIHCKVEGLLHVNELPLVDVGLHDENPNCQLVDDYAYWFLNAW